MKWSKLAFNKKLFVKFKTPIIKSSCRCSTLLKRRKLSITLFIRLSISSLFFVFEKNFLTLSNTSDFGYSIQFLCGLEFFNDFCRLIKIEKTLLIFSFDKTNRLVFILAIYLYLSLCISIIIYACHTHDCFYRRP